MSPDTPSPGWIRRIQPRRRFLACDLPTSSRVAQPCLWLSITIIVRLSEILMCITAGFDRARGGRHETNVGCTAQVRCGIKRRLRYLLASATIAYRVVHARDRSLCRRMYRSPVPRVCA
jgi:hypothetical protein